MPSSPYSVDEIYRIKISGKFHSLVLLLSATILQGNLRIRRVNSAMNNKCCKSREIAYNRNMSKINYIKAIAELSESEGVFTTAQAARLGIPRDALHDAAEAGRLERIARGAYRMVGSGSTQLDELVAIWKLTAPGMFAHERMQLGAWDGVVVGGSTAASILELGDFYVSPYRIYAPRRINSRNKAASFAVRDVPREDVSFVHGLPVTRPERTVFDLVADHEDMSLVADALRDATEGSVGFDLAKFAGLLASRYGQAKARHILGELGVDASSLEKGRPHEV